MAFLIKGNSFPQLCSHSQKVYDFLSLSRRGLHYLKPQERTLLEKDPVALSLYISIAKDRRNIEAVTTFAALAVFGYIGYDNARIQGKAWKKVVKQVLKEIGEEAQEKTRKSD